MILRLMVITLLVGTVTGCATAKKPSSNSHLQLRVAQAESRLDENEQDITELQYAVEELVSNTNELPSSSMAVRKRAKTTSVSSSKPAKTDSKKILRVPVTPKEVQTALKSAGYYNGAIDGKLGSGSQKAIKVFQKEHDLESDGIIGQKTWAELKNYLE